MTDSRNIFDDGQQRRRRTSSYDDLDQYAVDSSGDFDAGQNRARSDRNRAQRASSESARYSRDSAHYHHGGDRGNERSREGNRTGERYSERANARSGRQRPVEGRQRPAAERQRPAIDENGRVDSVYRPARNRARYERSSNRYTSANAENRREGRREVRSPHAQPQQQAATAGRYSRDRYVRQEGQQRAMSVSQQNFAATNRAKPVGTGVLAALGGVAAFLLIVIIARFMVFGGTAAEYGNIRSEIDAAQTHITELETSTNEAQTQIDSWQETIDIYNKSKK